MRITVLKFKIFISQARAKGEEKRKLKLLIKIVNLLEWIIPLIFLTVINLTQKCCRYISLIIHSLILMHRFVCRNAKCFKRRRRFFSRFKGNWRIFENLVEYLRTIGASGKLCFVIFRKHLHSNSFMYSNRLELF